MALNLFYAEPDPDRWLAYDRYPRRIIRRLLRGPHLPGGQMRMFLNLCQGLDRLGIAYRTNDYGYARRHPNELACIIGKPCVLDRMDWKNPILFGAAVHSHPSADPDLLQRRDIRKILVPGEWMRQMCVPVWGDRAFVWPVGIDTAWWSPTETAKRHDVLLYVKLRWDQDRVVPTLLDPIRAFLQQKGLDVHEIRYGAYRPEEYRAALRASRSMIFLCEHETQGLAYQEALSCGVPVFAWDRGGPWTDPEFYPHRVVYEPVSSVPYWDGRCGMRFCDAEDFAQGFEMFFDAVSRQGFSPRDYILDNLTLEKCAGHYVEIARSLGAQV
ncbi:MAG: glycosyltransferase family 1 protein [Alphaproteobacteria bacterium]|nr:glycosyltransferase family 1 protein [Alphaproteobacteria bacterium]